MEPIRDLRSLLLEKERLRGKQLQQEAELKRRMSVQGIKEELFSRPVAGRILKFAGHLMGSGLGNLLLIRLASRIFRKKKKEA
jgi:hypothetical protein